MGVHFPWCCPKREANSSSAFSSSRLKARLATSVSSNFFTSRRTCSQDPLSPRIELRQAISLLIVAPAAPPQGDPSDSSQCLSLRFRRPECSPELCASARGLSLRFRRCLKPGLHAPPASASLLQ